MNLGTDHEVTIRETVEPIARLVGFTGELVWDPTRPDGQPRRRVDAARAERLLGWRAQMPFEVGLQAHRRLVPRQPRRGRAAALSRSAGEDAGGDRRLAVGRGERVDRLVGVEPTGVRHDPQQPRPPNGLRLPAEHGVAARRRRRGRRSRRRLRTTAGWLVGHERPAVARRPRAARSRVSSDGLAPWPARTRLVIPMPRPMQVRAIGVGHARVTRSTSRSMIAGSAQRRIEAVARVGEVRVDRRGRPQARVDPDEQQPQPGTDAGRATGCIPERLQLGSREPHGGRLWAAGAGRRSAATVRGAGGRPPRCRRCNRCRPLRRTHRRSSGHAWLRYAGARTWSTSSST